MKKQIINSTISQDSDNSNAITHSKEDYIRQWRSYINPIYALCLNGNRELEKEIVKLLDRLTTCVDLVANEKEKLKAFSEDYSQ